MEEIRDVQSKQVDMKCPKCNGGYMRPNGLVKPSTPPWYGHICNRCGYVADYGVRYPHIV